MQYIGRRAPRRRPGSSCRDQPSRVARAPAHISEPRPLLSEPRPFLSEPRTSGPGIRPAAAPRSRPPGSTPRKPLAPPMRPARSGRSATCPRSPASAMGFRLPPSRRSQAARIELPRPAVPCRPCSATHLGAPALPLGTPAFLSEPRTFRSGGHGRPRHLAPGRRARRRGNPSLHRCAPRARAGPRPALGHPPPRWVSDSRRRAARRRPGSSCRDQPSRVGRAPPPISELRPFLSEPRPSSRSPGPSGPGATAGRGTSLPAAGLDAAETPRSTDAPRALGQVRDLPSVTRLRDGFQTPAVAPLAGGPDRATATSRPVSAVLRHPSRSSGPSSRIPGLPLGAPDLQVRGPRPAAAPRSRPPGSTSRKPLAPPMRPARAGRSVTCPRSPTSPGPEGPGLRTDDQRATRRLPYQRKVTRGDLAGPVRRSAPARRPRRWAAGPSGSAGGSGSRTADAIGDGTSPCRMIRVRRPVASGSATGTAESSAPV